MEGLSIHLSPALKSKETEDRRSKNSPNHRKVGRAGMSPPAPPFPCHSVIPSPGNKHMLSKVKVRFKFQGP